MSILLSLCSRSLLKLDDDESSSDVPFQARRLLKTKRQNMKSAAKKNNEKKTSTPKLGSIQPSLLDWRTPFDGMITPVVVVGGNTGVASEKWFDRCNSMVFVTKIAGVYLCGFGG
jgi:hypothetical protein